MPLVLEDRRGFKLIGDGEIDLTLLCKVRDKIFLLGFLVFCGEGLTAASLFPITLELYTCGNVLTGIQVVANAMCQSPVA